MNALILSRLAHREMERGHRHAAAILLGLTVAAVEMENATLDDRLAELSDTRDEYEREARRLVAAMTKGEA